MQVPEQVVQGGHPGIVPGLADFVGVVHWLVEDLRKNPLNKLLASKHPSRQLSPHLLEVLVHLAHFSPTNRSDRLTK